MPTKNEVMRLRSLYSFSELQDNDEFGRAVLYKDGKSVEFSRVNAGVALDQGWSLDAPEPEYLPAWRQAVEHTFTEEQINNMSAKELMELGHNHSKNYLNL